MWVEPTGRAVEMYSCTTALRIAVFRSSNMVLVQVIDGAPPAGTHSGRALTNLHQRRAVCQLARYRRDTATTRRALPACGRIQTTDHVGPPFRKGDVDEQNLD